MQCAKNRHEYFSHRLHHAIDGLGTNEYDLIFINFPLNLIDIYILHFSRNLIRIIVGRCDVDLNNIKQEYERKFSRSLQADVSVLKCFYFSFQ